MTVRSVQVIFRARLIYSKRGGACFVPHIALAQIFARSASRAGFSLEMTQGFSPRPRLSFGPELPAGVVALNEPLDIYFAQPYPDIITHMNDALPEGFALSQVWPVPENSPSLGKSCTHAEYFCVQALTLRTWQRTSTVKISSSAKSVMTGSESLSPSQHKTL